nr:MAG TPA_asm: hypothetical protein [Caudoviricetes sp.]
MGKGILYIVKTYYRKKAFLEKTNQFDFPGNKRFLPHFR